MLRNILHMRRRPLKHAVLKIHSKKALLQGLGETFKRLAQHKCISSVPWHKFQSLEDSKKAKVPRSAAPPLLLKCFSNHLMPACQISRWHVVAPNRLHQLECNHCQFPAPALRLANPQKVKDKELLRFSASSQTLQPSSAFFRWTFELPNGLTGRSTDLSGIPTQSCFVLSC